MAEGPKFHQLRKKKRSSEETVGVTQFLLCLLLKYGPLSLYCDVKCRWVAGQTGQNGGDES